MSHRNFTVEECFASPSLRVNLIKIFELIHFPCFCVLHAILFCILYQHREAIIQIRLLLTTGAAYSYNQVSFLTCNDLQLVEFAPRGNYTALISRMYIPVNTSPCNTRLEQEA